MSWVSLAIATIVAAVPVLASGVAIAAPPIRRWLSHPSRPWAIPLAAALSTSLVTTAIIVAILGAKIGPAGPHTHTRLG
jgi:hypothetical protein